MNTNPTLLSISLYAFYNCMVYTLVTASYINYKRLHAHSNAVRIHPIEQRERNLYKIKSV